MSDVEKASRLGSFVVDSGATDCILNSSSLFDKSEPCLVPLRLGDGTWVMVKHSGNVSFDGFSLFGLFAPEFKVNLISIPYLDKLGWRATFHGGLCPITDENGVLGITATLIEDLYVLSTPTIFSNNDRISVADTKLNVTAFALAARRAQRNTPAGLWTTDDPERILRDARKAKRDELRQLKRRVVKEYKPDLTSTKWDYRHDISSSSEDEPDRKELYKQDYDDTTSRSVLAAMRPMRKAKSDKSYSYKKDVIGS
ncbi:hypothetical protein EDC01DRAFT_631213 [Geopyxis carbonaria]|nr:hypothetical protein EDC01DRAFT_631213 [Geopyxis carbonaria]